MNRFIIPGGLLLTWPLAFLVSGCGGGNGGLITPTPIATTTATATPSATVTPTATATVTTTVTATPTATPNGNFNLSVLNSADSNWGLTSFQTTNVTSYTGEIKGVYRFINLFSVETNSDGTTNKLDIRLTKQGDFAVGDTFTLTSPAGPSLSFQAERSTSDPARSYEWGVQGGTGTISVSAISNNSVTLQFTDVKINGDLFGATGTITFNGSAQANLPPT